MLRKASVFVYYSSIGVTPPCSICGSNRGLMLVDDKGIALCHKCINQIFKFFKPDVKIEEIIDLFDEVKKKFEMGIPSSNFSG